MRVLVAVALALPLLAGCVGLDLGDCPPEPEAVRTPWVDGRFLDTDPGQTWDTLVLDAGGHRLDAKALAPGWTVESERISAAEDANFSLLRVSPAPGPGRLSMTYHYDCKAGSISWDLAAPDEGESAMAGEGVHVYTAGFWENGTLFYTNIEAIDHDDWPRAGWYAWEGADPLPVYIYDQDRSEQPAVWKDPQAGTPLAGTVPGLGYFTTIPGFNEALKGLSSTTVRVVRLTPEEGYTRAGNEEHPLYGDALVFYIKVVEVADLPCPVDAAWACSLPGQQRRA